MANLRNAIGASIGAEGVAELKQLPNWFGRGYGADRIDIDPSVARGRLCRSVFEAELTFAILDEKGRKRQFGSVAAAMMIWSSTPVKRCQPLDIMVSTDYWRPCEKRPHRCHAGGIGCGHGDGSRPDGRLSSYGIRVALAGIRAEVYLGNPKISAIS